MINSYVIAQNIGVFRKQDQKERFTFWSDSHL